jgi:hypothetical protein
MSGDRSRIWRLLWGELRSLATVLAVVGVLAGGWFGARLARDGWIRGELRQRIRTSTDADLKKWCGEAANAGRVGIALLLEIVDGEDPDQANQAGESLRALFSRYEALSPQAAGQEFTRFLDLCIGQADRLGPRGEDLVAECCERYLLWRHRHGPRDEGGALLQCQTLLARLAGRPNRDLGMPPPSHRLRPESNTQDGESNRQSTFPSVSVDTWDLEVDGPAGGGLEVKPFVGARNEIPNGVSSATSPDAVIPPEMTTTAAQTNQATDLENPDAPGEATGRSTSLVGSESRKRLTVATLASSRRLHSRDSTVVHDNYRLLRDSGWDDGDVDLAYRATHESASIRLEAIAMTRELPLELAEEWLWHLSQDADPEVRLASVGAMIKLESKSFRVRFEALAETDPDPRVRSLAAIGSRLFHVDPAIRQDLAKGISSDQPSLAGSVLLRLSQDDQPQVRIAALNGLATMTAPAAWARIAEMHRMDPDPDVRAEAGQRVTARESLDRR